MTNLTGKEINILVEALEAWETKDMAGELMMGMFGSLVCRDDEQREEWERLNNERKEKEETEKRERKETSLLLKAKLITIKQESMSSEVNEILSK